jgi:hypothetical protein
MSAQTTLIEAAPTRAVAASVKRLRPTPPAAPPDERLSFGGAQSAALAAAVAGAPKNAAAMRPTPAPAPLRAAYGFD